VKIASPIAITDATLVSSNVPEGAAAAYNAGATYAAGDVVSYSADGSLLLPQWYSLQSSNTGHTPGEIGSEAWWGSLATQAAAAYSAGTTYAAGDGVQIDTGGVHQLWWSVVDDNTGNTPADDAGDHWLLQSPTNRWAMFDRALGFSTATLRVATRWPELIDVTLAPTGPLDTVVAFVSWADTIQVTVTDALSVVIYDETLDLTGDPGQAKWQLDGVPHVRPFVFEDVVFTEGSEVRVQISKPGAFATCPELILGQSIDAGGTRWGSRVGIQDYSVVQANDFGVFEVTLRPWHRRASFDVLVAAADVDPLIEFLTLHRGSPLLFIGDATYRSTVVFGFFRAFEETIPWPDLTVLTIDLESI
jgi:hypothetical protein